MNNISVPSRFACLKIEDDDSRPRNVNQNKKKNDNNKVIAKKAVNGKKLASNATSTSNANKPSAKKTKNKPTDKQWEDWKKKDSEMVNDTFEQDLQDALLLSKLDYDSKINVITLGTKSAAANNTNNNKKKKTKTTMYLDEFLEGNDNKKVSNGDCASSQVDREDDQFFEKMLEQTKKEVNKGKVEEQRREREQNIEEIISLAQCQEKLQFEREKNHELQKELDKAKAEVASVKARNKMLCNVLGHGEMRDKAEILVELERLNAVKDELTDEVGHLHKLLEQERSKSTSLDTQSKQNKEKKRNKKL